MSASPAPGPPIVWRIRCVPVESRAESRLLYRLKMPMKSASDPEPVQRYGR